MPPGAMAFFQISTGSGRDDSHILTKKQLFDLGCAIIPVRLFDMVQGIGSPDLLTADTRKILMSNTPPDIAGKDDIIKHAG